MDEEDATLRALHAVEPREQLVVVGVAGVGIEDFDVSVDLEFVAEDVHLLVSFTQLPAECVLGAVADEEDDVALVFDVVAEVVQNTA